MSAMDGTVVIVTGGARGQGAAFARTLAERGAEVMLTDLLEAEGEEVASAIGDAAAFHRHDVSDATAWEEVVAATERRFGRITALVNNAGINRPATLLETDDANWASHLAVNQSGPFYGMRAVAPAIERAGGGAIVNICSGSALHGSHRYYAYSAAKWALRGMGRAAAVELAPRGIRVNSIFPGLVDTQMIRDAGFEDDPETLAKIPLGRLASTEDIANAVAYLLGPESTYMTGAEIVVDGGMFA
ncbi:MAG: SDR family NAD(P)-dependent oxidoreductase [Solirubrobacterales bacterium]